MPLFIKQSLVNVHLACFYFLDIVNRAAINIEEQTLLLIHTDSFGYMPRSSITLSSNSSLLAFLAFHKQFHISIALVYPLRKREQGSHFLYTLTNICCHLIFFILYILISQLPKGSEYILWLMLKFKVSSFKIFHLIGTLWEKCLYYNKYIQYYM